MVVINADSVGATLEIHFAYWIMCHGVRERVYVAPPNFVHDPDLEIGLAEAAERGPDVRLLLPKGRAPAITLEEVDGWSWFARARDQAVRPLREQL